MKKSTIVIFSLLAFVQGRNVQYEPVGSRIVNGEDAQPGQFPYQVSLQNSSHFCGGSIINDQWVVTAAHCVIKYRSLPTSVHVVIGTVSLKNPYRSHAVDEIIMHEKFDRDDSYINDIALVKVKEPFEFSDFVKPIRLPKPSAKVKTNSSAVVAGWGGLKNPWSSTPDKLQFAKIYVADPEYCKNVIKEVNKDIYPTSLCANNPSERRGECTGDSGGALVTNGEMIGIVSWSIKDPDCASTKYPGVYTRVSEYVNWIVEHITYSY